MWPAILFGWPAVIVALGLSLTGVVRRKPGWLLVAVILVVPISFYLVGSPRFWWLGICVPLLLSGAAIATHFRQFTLAWLLLLPFAGTFTWLALLVMKQ